MLRETYLKDELVILDETFRNKSEVTVVYQTTNKLFTRVKSDLAEWDVMTNRLTKIKK